MTKELFDKQLDKIKKFILFIENIKKQMNLSLKLGTNIEEKNNEINETLKDLEILLTNLNIMNDLIISSQKESDEEVKNIIYKNVKNMLKDIKNILNT